jgi:hypothetical protein
MSLAATRLHGSRYTKHYSKSKQVRRSYRAVMIAIDFPHAYRLLMYVYAFWAQSSHANARAPTSGSIFCSLSIPSPVFSYFVDTMETPSLFNNVSDFPTTRQSRIHGFGHGAKLSVSHGTVHEAFESIVDTHPAVVAAIHGTQSITYLQLDLAANRLAHYVISSGLRPRKRVCLVVQRSIEMLIGFLAILKAGCQYVPIDGGVASDEALRHIFADTEARFILCLPRYWDRVKQFASQEAIVLELGMNTGAYYSPLRPGIPVTSDDGVYAMYTSGMSLPQSNRAITDYLTREYGCTERCGRQAWHQNQRSSLGTWTDGDRCWLKGRTSFEHLFRHG